MSQKEQFAADVREGLSKANRTLPSKWFYDETGDDLFVQIMHMPEYYLTRAEFEIFSEQTSDVIQAINVSPETHFDLIELGAGDGTKTKQLLGGLIDGGYSFDYVPIDISSHALDALHKDLQDRWPELHVQPQQGLYFQVLKDLASTERPKVVLFLGSNLGNLSDERASAFLGQLAHCLRTGDRVLIGLDLKKSEDVVLPAYNDSQGITARFNLNVLTRINRELGGNFKVDQFAHRPEYTEEEGIARSFLESLQDQQVRIDALGASFSFQKGERIHTEVSRKYNDDILTAILSSTGLEVTARITDSKDYFADFILKRS